jgi:hypothetical protein
LPNQVFDVSKLTTSQLQEGQIWASRIAKDAPPDEAQEVGFPLRHTLSDCRLRFL